MIEGIDYYPKQKNKRRYSQFWIVLLLLVATAIIYWASNKTSIETQSELISIVISEPATELLIEPTLPTINLKRPERKTPELLEQLDALVLIPEKETL